MSYFYQKLCCRIQLLILTKLHTDFGIPVFVVHMEKYHGKGEYDTVNAKIRSTNKGVREKWDMRNIKSSGLINTWKAPQARENQKSTLIS